jgi:formylglycine-generating enzyme required for sulfatase activity
MPGDRQKFVNIALTSDRAVVRLVSDGGNLREALEIGKAVRMKGFPTYVPPHGLCASACALIWLAGSPRRMSSSAQIGFHAVYVDESGVPEISAPGNAIVGSYLNALGLPEAAVLKLTSAAPNDMHWLTPSEASRFGIDINVLNDDPAAGPQAVPEAAQAWIAVENTQSEAVLDEYIRRFPRSVYAGFATARLEELKKARQALNTPKPWSSETDACDGVFVSVAIGGEKPCVKPGYGVSFKDCPDCPEMVIIPAGSFTMGSPENEPQRKKDEGPQHKVTISKPFAVGKFAVTFAEWDACVAAGGCGAYKPEDGGWGRGDRPVINMNWSDAKAYVAWLSKKTGATYRLLSEAEREYAARAGTATPFWWGSSIMPEQANYDDNYVLYIGGGKKRKYRTVPVNSFKSNPWGLYQVHGNVWEWVEDCWHDNYSGAPTDGSAWASGDCSRRVLRGGSLFYVPSFLRAAYRLSNMPGGRSFDFGFRLARTLNP